MFKTIPFSFLSVFAPSREILFIWITGDSPSFGSGKAEKIFTRSREGTKGNV